MSEITKILVVDDEPAILCMLKKVLETNSCEVILLDDSQMAVNMAHSCMPDLILLDIQMPGMDGFAVCTQFKSDAELKDIPIIFLSGQNATKDIIKGFDVGGVDYITKPFHIEEVRARVGTHLHLCSLKYKLAYLKQVEEKNSEVLDAQLTTIFALAKLAEYRDEDTGRHLERVREYCRLLAEKLREDSPYIEQISDEFIICIQNAAPLHDIGKVAIPDKILLKPEKLTPEEFEIMKTHSAVGAENLQMVYRRYPNNVFIGMGIEIALHHHEHWDGAGYPDGLKGSDIPLAARIIALADFYDALCSDRCYRKAFSHDHVTAMIVNAKGSHFDPIIVAAFMAIEKDFLRVQQVFAE